MERHQTLVAICAWGAEAQGTTQLTEQAALGKKAC